MSVSDGQGDMSGSALGDMGGLASVREGLEDGDCVAVTISSEVIEVVGACNDLVAALDDGEGLVLGAEFGIDGSSESIDTGSVLSSNSAFLGGSKHFQKILYTDSYLLGFNCIIV